MADLGFLIIIIFPVFALGFLIYIKILTKHKLKRFEELKNEYIIDQSEKVNSNYLCTKEKSDLWSKWRDFMNGDGD